MWGCDLLGDVEGASLDTDVDRGFLFWQPPADRPGTAFADRQPWPTKEILPELVIRELLLLDTTDDRDVVAFMRAHGVLGRRHHAVAVERPSGLTEASMGFVANHVWDARAFLQDVQQLARHWIAWKDDDYVAPIWYDVDLRRASTKKARAAIEDDAWSAFTRALNDGLREFAMHGTYRRSDGLVIGAPSVVNLYAALCLQLHNLIVEDLPLLTCANETCRTRRFVRQRGGAKHAQYRTAGVIYCSPGCAQAQKQREYRLRKKAST